MMVLACLRGLYNAKNNWVPVPVLYRHRLKSKHYKVLIPQWLAQLAFVALNKFAQYNALAISYT